MTTQAHAQLLAAADLGHLAEMSDPDFEAYVLPDLRALADRLGDSMHFGDRDRALVLDLCERFAGLVEVARQHHHACPRCQRAWVADAEGIRQACPDCYEPAVEREVA